MTSIILTTIISCTQAIGIVNRVTSVVGLSDKQKSQIIIEIKKSIPSCPIKIEKK